MRYASRFVLPLLLLGGCVAAWLVANALGSGNAESEAVSSTESVAAPLASIRRLPALATSSLRSETSALALASLPTDPAGLSCAVVLVDGEPILDLRGERALVPSYAQLLTTAHAALDVLGPDYRFETRAMAEELPDDDGRLFADLYLVGGGDPVLTTFGYSLGFRPALAARTAIEDLVAGVGAAGVVRIDGSIVAIERRYDTERFVPGWPSELVTSGVVGPLSAMQLDDGFTERPAANGGVAIAAEEPATVAAAQFNELLRASGIEIFGGNRTLADDVDLPELVPVARLSSPPLHEIVLQMMATNDASASELLMKELGFVTVGTGSTQAGALAVQQVLERQGVSVSLPFRDGSGLDPLGGVSCNQLALAADSIAEDHPTLEALPAYNLPGVFDGAFAALDIDADLRLVGGVQGDASGLVARTNDPGPRVTIASIVNRPQGVNEADLAFQQALVELVDDLRVSITVDGLALDE